MHIPKIPEENVSFRVSLDPDKNLIFSSAFQTLKGENFVNTLMEVVNPECTRLLDTFGGTLTFAGPATISAERLQKIIKYTFKMLVQISTHNQIPSLYHESRAKWLKACSKAKSIIDWNQ